MTYTVLHPGREHRDFGISGGGPGTSAPGYQGTAKFWGSTSYKQIFDYPTPPLLKGQLYTHQHYLWSEKEHFSTKTNSVIITLPDVSLSSLFHHLKEQKQVFHRNGGITKWKRNMFTQTF